MILIMIELIFLCQKKILTRLKQKILTRLKQKHICINVFCYENRLTFPIYSSNQKFENSMDLLLVTDGYKSHYVYIRDFNRFLFHKTKNKNKICFCKSCWKCVSSKHKLTEHKEVCLSVSGAQSVRLEKGAIGFKNYFKQILVPFKTYIKSVESYDGFNSKKYQDHIPFSFGYKLVCVDDKFTKPIVVFKGENAAY